MMFDAQPEAGALVERRGEQAPPAPLELVERQRADGRRRRTAMCTGSVGDHQRADDRDRQVLPGLRVSSPEVDRRRNPMYAKKMTDAAVTRRPCLGA
jgi:hypothetical protein